MDPSREVARGAAATFVAYLGKVARPVAIAVFARLYGLAPVGVALAAWAYVELVARVAGLGLDRGLQRWIPATPEADRPAVVGVALALTGLATVPAALGLAVVLPAALDLDGAAALATRLVALAVVPATALSTIALHAVRGTRRIGPLVIARNVVEPVGFLVAGLAAAPFLDGVVALLVAYAASVLAVAIVAAAALRGAFGAGAFAGAARVRAAAPTLLRFSIPLGLADAVNLALQRGDVIAVGVVTGSATITGAYGVAREIVASLSKIRQGFDQVLAPVAAELHVAGRPGELGAIAAAAARWGLVLAAPIAAVLIVFPEGVLAVFGVRAPVAATSLAILAIGRTVDTATGPTAVLLGMVGRPRLVLLDGVVGLAIAVGGAALLGPALGAPGVALATGAGLVASNLLALLWLARLDGLRPLDRRLVPAAGVAALALAALVLVRSIAGVPSTPALVAVLVAWAIAYVVTVVALGLWPWRRAPAQPCAAEVSRCVS